MRLQSFPSLPHVITVYMLCLLNSLDRCIDLFDSPTLEIPNSVALTLRQIGHLLFSDIKSRRLEVSTEPLSFFPLSGRARLLHRLLSK